MRRDRRERGVAMVEFALVFGLFFLVVSTLFDVGKGVYVKNTLDAAARDGARASVVLNNPTLKQVEDAIKQHSSDVAFAAPCPFSTPTTAGLNDNTGAIYINKMPEGGAGGVSVAGCGAFTTARNHAAITVVIMYKYKPITPLVAQFLGGALTFESSSTMKTEY